MLVAATSDPPIPVWRVSSGEFAPTDDRQADGELVTLRVSTQPIPLPEPPRDVVHDPAAD
jgi:hypothetical protein